MIKEGRLPKGAKTPLNVILVTQPMYTAERTGYDPNDPELDYESLSEDESFILTNNFEEWTYEIVFGTNYNIFDFVKYEYEMPGDAETLQYILENKEAVVGDMIKSAKAFESAVIKSIRTHLGQRFEHPYNQLFGLEGEALYLNMKREIMNKINTVKTTNKPNMNPDKVANLSVEFSMDPMILTYPFNISPKLNDAFNNRGMTALTKSTWKDIHVKLIMLYVANLVMQGLDSRLIGDQVAKDLTSARDVRAINVDSLNWKPIDDIAFDIDEYSKDLLYASRYSPAKSSLMGGIGEGGGAIYYKAEV